MYPTEHTWGVGDVSPLQVTLVGVSDFKNAGRTEASVVFDSPNGKWGYERGYYAHRE